MKKLLTFSLAVILCANMFSQPPSKISYQSVVRTSDNNLITNQQVGICISILQGSETGLEVYKEIYYPNPQTNFNGLVTIEIGTGIPLKGDFSTVDWSNGPYYLRTEIDPTGGTIYTISGTSQLLSVPYSLYAKTSESISGEIPETDPIFRTWDKSTGISITESQINDLGNYIESETDPVFTAWDKSSDIIISEVQITDLQNYLVSESDPAVTANFDFTDAAIGFSVRCIKD